MKDIRIFIKDKYLYVYDRAKIRIGEHVQVLALSRGRLGTYYVRSVNIVVEDNATPEIEKSLVGMIDSLGLEEEVGLTQLGILLSSVTDLEMDSCENIISSIPRGNMVSKIDSIMQEILSLEYRDRAEVIMRVLDLL